jgi:hypothetical protein
MTDIEGQVRSYATMLDNVEPVVASDVIGAFASPERPRRRLLRVAVVTFVAIVVAICGVIVLVDDDGGGSPHRPGVAAPPSQEWSTVTDNAHGISISYPPSWQAAPSTLTPVLVDPVVPIAVATYPLDNPQVLGECDIVPQRALEAMGPTDAFIAVYLFLGKGATYTPSANRPAHFGPDLPWTGGSLPERASGNGIQCTENVPGFVRQLSFEDHGQHLNVLIAIGPEASAETRDEVYRILDTLTVTQ